MPKKKREREKNTSDDVFGWDEPFFPFRLDQIETSKVHGPAD